MCGIYGAFGPTPLSKHEILSLAKFSKRRGSDASGAVAYGSKIFTIFRANDSSAPRQLKRHLRLASLVAGHSRLITHGHTDNQPIWKSGVLLFHNGIILNTAELWEVLGERPVTNIDTEILGALIRKELDKGFSPEESCHRAIALCRGVVNVAVLMPDQGKLVLASNTGSMYVGNKSEQSFFASERRTLESVGCGGIKQVLDPIAFEIAENKSPPTVDDKHSRSESIGQYQNVLLPEVPVIEYPPENLKRCSICILPETMPFITFDESGMCNFCESSSVLPPKGTLESLRNQLESRYQLRPGGRVLMPFSGGRDSSYGLHLVVRETDLTPVAFTYDWGMVSDVGRRNASRMCAELGVEQLIVAADINRKRENIRKNVVAWLSRPHLGMVNLFTAGDKHFFKYLNLLKNETGILPNLWAFNPLETTHFKTGFLGVPPDFLGEKVYSTGIAPQLRYQGARLSQFLKNPKYFNSSLVDTISGEYHRSIRKTADYFQLFDYVEWNEDTVDTTLVTQYGWELATESSSSWRIGDATAPFYNYIFRTVAGFTEYDTFRSNQIRAGHITRAEALEKVSRENAPRPDDLRWYIETIGLDFRETVERINQIPRLY